MVPRYGSVVLLVGLVLLAAVATAAADDATADKSGKYRAGGKDGASQGTAGVNEVHVRTRADSTWAEEARTWHRWMPSRRPKRSLRPSLSAAPSSTPRLKDGQPLAMADTSGRYRAASSSSTRLPSATPVRWARRTRTWARAPSATASQTPSVARTRSRLPSATMGPTSTQVRTARPGRSGQNGGAVVPNLSVPVRSATPVQSELPSVTVSAGASPLSTAPPSPTVAPSPSPETEQPPTPLPAPTPAPLAVLFIGNSYTYVHDVNVLWASLSQSANRSVITGRLASAGWTLQQHAEDDRTREVLGQRQWDLVVLQEQSQIPSSAYLRETMMYPAARALAAMITSPIMFYMTWGRRNGMNENGWYFRDYTAMQTELTAAYMAIGAELGAAVAPVGDTWAQVRAQRPDIELYQGDGSHASLAGAYLIASVFYAAIWRAPAADLTYVPADLDPAVAQFLRSSADSVVLANLTKYHLQ